MTLLAPMSAVLAGALALPVLIAFYMLKLRRRPLTVSATFLWEQAAHDIQGNVPLRWLRPSLLFLLHALILALLVLALGRPAVERAGPSSARAFFLIDVSASMGARDGGGGRTRLEQAKLRALSLGRDLFDAPGRPVISVVAFAHEARIASRPVDSLRELRRALEALEPMDQPGRLEPALRLTESLINRPTEEGVEVTAPVVAVFSDGGFADDAPLAMSGAQVTLVPIETAPEPGAGNLAIVACSAARSEADPEAALVFVRIESTFRRGMPASLSLLVDGLEARTHAVMVPAADDDGTGTVGQSFPVRLPGAGLVTAALTLDDLLDSDNSASVYLPSPLRPRVMLVHPDGDEPDAYLRDVLEEVPLRSLRVVPAGDYARFAPQSLSGAADLVVFDRVAPSVFPPVPTVSFGAWGGGLTTEPSPQSGGFILSWERSSPLLAHVTLDAVQVARLAPSPSAAALRLVGRVSDLAQVRGGSAITRVDTPTGPRVFVAFALSDSNWPLHFSFPIFMLNAVDALTGAAASRSSIAFTTTEPVIVWTNRAGATLSLDGPTPVTVRRASDEPGFVSLGVFGRAGVYWADPVVPPVIAVNLLSGPESELAVNDRLVVGGSEAPRLEATAGRREVWHLFLAAAGVLLVVEWMLFAVRVRG